MSVLDIRRRITMAMVFSPEGVAVEDLCIAFDPPATVGDIQTWMDPMVEEGSVELRLETNVVRYNATMAAVKYLPRALGGPAQPPVLGTPAAPAGSGRPDAGTRTASDGRTPLDTSGGPTPARAAQSTASTEVPAGAARGNAPGNVVPPAGSTAANIPGTRAGNPTAAPEPPRGHAGPDDRQAQRAAAGTSTGNRPAEAVQRQPEHGAPQADVAAGNRAGATGGATAAQPQPRAAQPLDRLADPVEAYGKLFDAYVFSVVRTPMDRRGATVMFQIAARRELPPGDLNDFVEYAFLCLDDLTLGQAMRYGLTAAQYEAWRRLYFK